MASVAMQSVPSGGPQGGTQYFNQSSWVQDLMRTPVGKTENVGSSTWESQWLKNTTLDSSEFNDLLKNTKLSSEPLTTRSVKRLVPLISSTAYGLAKRGGFKGGLPAHLARNLAREVLNELLSGNADSLAEAFRNVMRRLLGLEDEDSWALGPVYGHQNFVHEETCGPQVGCGPFTDQSQWTSVPNGVFTPCGAGCVGTGTFFATFEAAAADPSGAGLGSRVFNAYEFNNVGFFAAPKEKWLRVGLGPAPDLRYTYRLQYKPWEQPWTAPLKHPLPQPSPWADPDGRPWFKPSALPATQFEFGGGGGGGKPPIPVWHVQGPGDRAAKRKAPFGFFAALRILHAASEVCDFFRAVADGLGGVRVHRSQRGKGTAQQTGGCWGNIMYTIDNFHKLGDYDEAGDWKPSFDPMRQQMLADIIWNIGENAVQDRALGKLLGAKWVIPGQSGLQSGSYGEGAYVETSMSALMEAF